MKNKIFYNFINLLVKSKVILGTGNIETIKDHLNTKSSHNNLSIGNIILNGNNKCHNNQSDKSQSNNHENSNNSLCNSNNESCNNQMLETNNRPYDGLNNEYCTYYNPSTELYEYYLKSYHKRFQKSNNNLLRSNNSIKNCKFFNNLYFSNGKLNSFVLKKICDDYFFKSKLNILAFKSIIRDFRRKERKDNFNIWFFSYSNTMRCFMEYFLQRNYFQVKLEELMELWEYFKYFFIFKSIKDPEPDMFVFKSFYLGIAHPRKLIEIEPNFYQNLFYENKDKRRSVEDVLKEYENVPEDTINLLEWSLKVLSTEEVYQKMNTNRPKVGDDKYYTKLYNLLAFKEIISPEFITNLKKCYEHYKDILAALKISNNAFIKMDNYFLGIIKLTSERLYNIFKNEFVYKKAQNFDKIFYKTHTKFFSNCKGLFTEFSFPIIESLIWKNDEKSKYKIFNILNIFRNACFSIDSLARILFIEDSSAIYSINRSFKYIFLNFLEFENVEIFFNVNYEYFRNK